MSQEKHDERGINISRLLRVSQNSKPVIPTQESVVIQAHSPAGKKFSAGIWHVAIFQAAQRYSQSRKWSPLRKKIKGCLYHCCVMKVIPVLAQKLVWAKVGYKQQRKLKEFYCYELKQAVSHYEIFVLGTPQYPVHALARNMLKSSCALSGLPASAVKHSA